MGYHQAGWEVVGVDIAPQPRYPFEFHQADALSFLNDHADDFDAVHASPPCHDATALKSLSGLDGTGWLLDATRRALIQEGKPFVLENVPGARMAPLVVLCGSMFNLAADGRILRRHRWFETTAFTLTPPDSCVGRPVGGVYGHGGGQLGRGFKFATEPAGRAMGIDWMTKAGLSQAIPPAYTEYLGAVLLGQVRPASALVGQ
jgi:DNA (cytosine-5)-methyltransferase 1